MPRWEWFACAVLLCLTLMSGCDEATVFLEAITGEGMGTLTGTVTIGPLCPVEPCNLAEDQMARVYEARKVFVYKQSTEALVAQQALSADGKYLLQLEPGSYIVDVSNSGGAALPLDLANRQRLGNATPQQATVNADETTVVDFDIDTGIR